MTDGPGDGVLRLPARGRAVRAAGLAVAGLLFGLGSVVGADDWWPFSPWRMFATSTAPSGAVITLSIEHRVDGDARWRPAPLTPAQVGLNRAEVEGRVQQIAADPAMLGTLAASHARLQPDDAAWTAVRVVRTVRMLADRRTTGEVSQEIVATWTADGAAAATGGSP